MNLGLFMDINCGGEFVLKIIRFIWRLLDMSLIIIPMGLIVMVMVDFAKSVIAGQEGDMKKNLNIALKRIIFAMAIFLVPFIVSAVISLLGENGVDYAVCLEIAKSKDDLAQYRTKFESDDYANTQIVVPDGYIKKEKKKKKANSLNKDDDSSGTNTSSSGSTKYGSPNWNSEAWKKNAYSCMGQCTWFAWGRFYEIYGYSPGFTGNGNECAQQLVNAHPDKFVRSSTPREGAIFSGDSAHNHVGLVVGVSGDNITIQEGNLDGEKVACYQGTCSKLMNCDSFGFAKNDWQEVTISLRELRNRYGNVVFANPKSNASSGSGRLNHSDR